jgi:hypothetical protein
LPSKAVEGVALYGKSLKGKEENFV